MYVSKHHEHQPLRNFEAISQDTNCQELNEIIIIIIIIEINVCHYIVCAVGS